MSALRAVTATKAASIGTLQLRGYHVPSDFGEPETFVWDRSSSATDDGCTVINPAGSNGPGRWLLKWKDTLSIAQCGATADGKADGAPAIAAALSAAGRRGGATIVLPCGVVVLASDVFRSFHVPNHTTIQGRGRDCAVLAVAGSREVNQIFIAANPSDVWLEHFTMRGNSIAAGPGVAGAVLFAGTKTAGAVMRNFGLRDMAFRNFRHDYWVSVENESAYDMVHVVIDGPRIETSPGNMRDPNALGVPSAIFDFRGQMHGAKGIIRDISITQAHANGEHVKIFAIFWSGTMDGHVAHNVLRNFGAHAGSNAGAYTILTYDSLDGAGLPPTDIWVVDNTIVNPKSCGWYGADAVGVHINGNTISGQSDTADGTLPKGAIAFNHTSGEAVGNILNDNLYGIEVAKPTKSVVVAENTVSSRVGGGKGIEVKAGISGTGSVVLRANTVHELATDSQALLLRGDSASPLGKSQSTAARMAEPTLTSSCTTD